MVTAINGLVFCTSVSLCVLGTVPIFVSAKMGLSPLTLFALGQLSLTQNLVHVPLFVPQWMNCPIVSDFPPQAKAQLPKIRKIPILNRNGAVYPLIPNP
jgi:hypothetical protein